MGRPKSRILITECIQGLPIGRRDLKEVDMPACQENRLDPDGGPAAAVVGRLPDVPQSGVDRVCIYRIKRHRDVAGAALGWSRIDLLAVPICISDARERGRSAAPVIGMIGVVGEIGSILITAIRVVPTALLRVARVVSDCTVVSRGQIDDASAGVYREA